MFLSSWDGWTDPCPFLFLQLPSQELQDSLYPASGKSSSFDILLLPFSPALSLLSPLEQP